VRGDAGGGARFGRTVNVSSCRTFQSGLKMLDVAEGKYGTHLNVYDWQERRLLQRIDLGNEGTMTFEIRCAKLKYKIFWGLFWYFIHHCSVYCHAVCRRMLGLNPWRGCDFFGIGSQTRYSMIYRACNKETSRMTRNVIVDNLAPFPISFQTNYLPGSSCFFAPSILDQLSHFR
jgi:hypothetical protein